MTGRSAYRQITPDDGDWGRGDISLEQYHSRYGVANESEDGYSTVPSTTDHQVDSHLYKTWSRKHESSYNPVIPSDTGAASIKGWTPFYLRRGTLLFFVVVEVAILIGLVLLYAFDQRNDGLATTDSSRHFFWTYGPTAVLASVAALWSQVEHRAKQMEPWRLMAQGSTPAVRTLMLDYVSLAQPHALWRSLGARHWPVALAITASLLIKLLTLLSTGLLMLQYVSREYKNVGLLATDRFDTSLWGGDSSDFASIAMPVLAAMAIESYGLPFPKGTSRDFAIPSLILEDLGLGEPELSSATFELQLDAFHAELDCEAASLSVYTNEACVNNTDSDCWLAPIDLHVESPSCAIGDFGWLDKFQIVSDDTLFGLTAPVNCTNLSDGQNPNRTLITTGFLLGQETSGAWYPDRVENATALVCEVKYGAPPSTAVIDSTGNVVSVTQQVLDIGNYPIGNVSSSVLDERLQLALQYSANPLEGVLSSLGEMVDMTTNNITYDNHPYDLDFDYFFRLVGAAARPTTYDFFLDQDVVLDHATKLYSLMAAQLAKESLMVPASTHANATAHVTEARLRVRGLSLYGMFGTLAVLIILTGTLCFLAPRQVVTRDPGSIGGLATILARSQGLCNSLQRPGMPSKPSLRRMLAAKYCKTVTEPGKDGVAFKIILETKSNDGKVSDEPAAPVTVFPREELQWWRPWPLSAATKISVMIFLVALIAALAVLSRVSSSHDGLAFVETEDYTRYTWVYIPALMMLIVQQLVDAISFASKILMPYHELRHSPSSARHTLLNDQLSRFCIQSLFNSIAWQHWGITATSLAMLLAPFLTIIASGLYSTELVKSPVMVDLATTSVFNSSFYENTDIGLTSGVAYLVSMIYGQNLSYPAWTYGSLAFDQIDIQDNRTDMSDTNLTVRVPAVRASMNCTRLLPASLNITISNRTIEGLGQVEVRWLNPAGASQCYENDTTISIPNDPKTPIGYIEWLDYYEQQKNCPRAMAIYGLANDSSSSLNVLACQIPIDTVQVDAVFSLPDYSIISAIVDEATAEPFTDIGDKWAGEFWNMDDLLNFENISAINNSGDASLQGTFEALYAWYSELNFDDLVPDSSSADASAHKIAGALSDLTGTIHAQYANLAGRIPPAANVSQSQRHLNGTLDQPGRLRLQQNPLSTYILQGILAVIALCVALSFWSMSTKDILPINPCSVGSAASLLAGAEMLKGIPAGAELCTDDRELAGMGVFAGGLFSLGWWGEDWGSARFGIDYGRSSE
ncbi:hypothetical protein BJ170DRAFT_94376 [Xylariales sp. AK1849]|nr:hypothetical protein BJ170DRAFT_94376 [Xylariales sp. AK1849]